MVGERLLVIDDDPRISESLQDAFDKYQFIPCLSGVEGLEKLSCDTEIDLVLLDYRLKDMDGLTILKKIRESGNKIGIILITAYSDKELIIKCLENNANNFVEKPFRFDEIDDKIQKALKLTHRVRTPRIQARAHVLHTAEFISSQEGKDITLNGLSRRLNCSSKYYSRIFKQNMGKTFTEYRLRIKMQKAKKLLSDTEYSINHISNLLGYMNPSAFMKIFKKLEGVTPSQYRKTVQS